MIEVLLLSAAIAVTAAVIFAWFWWRRARALTELSARCTHLEMSLAAAKRSLVQLTTQQKEKQIAAAALKEGLLQSTEQVERLRDLVKMHVARRREFEEWANPIRASLGEGVGKILQELKDRVARQEFSIRRQERVVAEAQDQYRSKRDEMERLRRELTLKNYHIAALNERFIRIEERIEELNPLAELERHSASASAPQTLTGNVTSLQSDRLQSMPSVSPETERFSLESDATKDWMGVLDDWQRQLQSRFERLDELQTQLRATAGKQSEDIPQGQKRDGSAA